MMRTNRRTITGTVLDSINDEETQTLRGDLHGVRDPDPDNLDNMRILPGRWVVLTLGT